MQKNTSTTPYVVKNSGFTFSDITGTNDKFSGSVIIPELIPSGETLMCVTDFNLIIPYIVLSLANRLQKRFASTKYTLKNYKVVRPNRTLTYSATYSPLDNSCAKIKIHFFDNDVLVAQFKGKEKVK
jgi:hypothetical protein